MDFQDPAHLIDDIGAHADELRPCAEHGAHSLMLDRFERNGVIPAHAHQFGDALRVVFVGFIQPHAERRSGLTRVNADDRQIEGFEAMEQPD